MKSIVCLLVGWTLSGLGTVTALANIGDTYRTSASRYHDRGVRYGDHISFSCAGYVVTEGFSTAGRCNIILYSRIDGRVMEELELKELLSMNLRSGFNWQEYPDTGGRTWSAGNNAFLAMFYLNYRMRGNDASTAVAVPTLRIGTHDALADRGYIRPDNDSIPANGPIDGGGDVTPL
jgi:hypothetical protein